MKVSRKPLIKKMDTPLCCTKMDIITKANGKTILNLAKEYTYRNKATITTEIGLMISHMG